MEFHAIEPAVLGPVCSLKRLTGQKSHGSAQICSRVNIGHLAESNVIAYKLHLQNVRRRIIEKTYSKLWT